MTELLRTNNLAQAHGVLAALQAAGIQAHISGEHGGSISDGGVSIIVPNQDDVLAARLALKELEEAPESGGRAV